MREPRDVIAHGIYNYEESVCGGHPGTWQLYERAYPASARADREKADAILAALHDAGYEVVQRGEYIAIKIDPTMPDNTIEMRSDVDSVWAAQQPDGSWEWRKAKGVLKDLAPGVPSEDLIRGMYTPDEAP